MSAAFYFVLALAVPGQARPTEPQIDLILRGGNVWLTVARATPVQVIETWARQGHTEVVGMEHLRGEPIDLSLANVTEDNALATLLGPGLGYLAVIRRDVAPGESRFQRIWILPGNSSATAASRAASVPPPDPAVVEPIVGPDGRPVPDDQQRDPAERVPYRSMPPGFSPPPEPGRPE